MQVPFTSKLACIHLDQFSEIFTARPSGMGLCTVNHTEGRIETQMLFSGRHSQFFLHLPPGRLLGAGRDEAFLHRSVGNTDASSLRISMKWVKRIARVSVHAPQAFSSPADRRLTSLVTVAEQLHLRFHHFVYFTSVFRVHPFVLMAVSVQPSSTSAVSCS